MQDQYTDQKFWYLNSTGSKSTLVISYLSDMNQRLVKRDQQFYVMLNWFNIELIY